MCMSCSWGGGGQSEEGALLFPSRTLRAPRCPMGNVGRLCPYQGFP